MIGQDNPCVNNKRVALFDRLNHLAQDVDFLDQQVIAVPLQQVDGEKVCAAGTPGASVVGHSVVIVAMSCVVFVAFHAAQCVMLIAPYGP